MIAGWLAWVGLTLVFGVVGSYWAYTLLGWTKLEFLVGPRTRQFTVLLGVLLSTMVLGFQALETEEDAIRLHHLWPPVLCVLGFAYAMRRQWLIPKPAPRFEPCDVNVPDDMLLAVVGDGRAVPLCWLSQYRTVRMGPALLVHCGLGRSLTAFSADGVGHDFAAILPHQSGFYVGAGLHSWDGVDGAVKNKGNPLRRLTVTLCRAKAWQSASATKAIYGPRGVLPKLREDKFVPRLPGARNVVDPMSWGTVVEGSWRSLDEEELDQCRPELLGTGEDASFYLSRWAAATRGYLPKD